MTHHSLFQPTNKSNKITVEQGVEVELAKFGGASYLTEKKYSKFEI